MCSDTPTTQPAPAPRDAFRDRLAEAGDETGRPELAHQCQGRPMTAAEDALADALMEIYAAGAVSGAEVAAALTTRGVAIPGQDSSDWTEDLLAQSLTAINAALDAAYLEHGYGA